jgi:hypothetical protein
MKNIPDKIWLVTGLSNTDEEVKDFKELSEVTWSEEKIFDHDIPFERAINKNDLWHSVADGGLPPKAKNNNRIDFSVEVLVRLDKVAFGRYDYTDKSWYIGLQRVYPTHWMEIPQLPKKGGK